MSIEIHTYSEMLAFARAAQEGSFSAAARAHGMSPSAISKLVTRLENRLAVRLFNRQSRSVELSVEGQVYYRSVRAALDAMDDASAAGELLTANAKGTLRIHTMQTFARHQIVPWLHDFLSLHPDLHLEFELTPQFVDLFDQGIDIAIHSGSLKSSSRVARKIAASRWVVCAAPGYIKRFGTPRSPGELATHRCLTFGFPGSWRNWSFKGNRAVAMPSHVTSSQGDLLRDMALQGTGIARLAEFHISSDLETGALIPLLEEHMDPMGEPIYMIYTNRRNLSPRISTFAAALESHLRKQRWNVG